LVSRKQIENSYSMLMPISPRKMSPLKSSSTLIQFCQTRVINSRPRELTIIRESSQSTKLSRRDFRRKRKD